MTKLWDKGLPIDECVLRFTVGNDADLDNRLVAYDVKASLAHGQMLMEQKYLTAEDFARIAAALEEIGAAHARGEWRVTVADEDVHTALENRLIAKIGEAGERIHLGRSRNDQVLTAVRLYLKDAIAQCADGALRLGHSLRNLAQAHAEVPIPGYTHMQRAMPSSVREWALGYISELEDDRLALLRMIPRVDKNPLGSAAGYGVPLLNLNRQRTAELLGFRAVHEPVTAVQLSRGKGEAALLFELVLLMQDVGRLASELCLFCTSEFAFVQLPDALTTGSSIMPQKRNPDVLELVRAHAAQISGDLLQVLMIPAKLPSGYHRDLQLIKEPLFRAIDRTLAAMEILAHTLRHVRFNAERTRAAMDPTLYATESAYRKVRDENMTFRAAYRAVAEELKRPPAK